MTMFLLRDVGAEALTEILLAPAGTTPTCVQRGEMIRSAKLIVPVSSTLCRLWTLQILTYPWMIGMDRCWESLNQLRQHHFVVIG